MYLEGHFRIHEHPSQIDLLKLKVNYPYTYVDGFLKFFGVEFLPKQLLKEMKLQLPALYSIMQILLFISLITRNRRTSMACIHTEKIFFP